MVSTWDLLSERHYRSAKHLTDVGPDPFLFYGSINLRQETPEHVLEGKVMIAPAAGPLGVHLHGDEKPMAGPSSGTVQGWRVLGLRLQPEPVHLHSNF